VGVGCRAHRSRGVSVINKMLQELDRRNAAAGSEGEQPPVQVKAVSAPPSRGHELFWGIVAVLMLAAVGWVGWVGYQLQPRTSVATALAYKAAEQQGTIGLAATASPQPRSAPQRVTTPGPVALPESAMPERAAPKPAPPQTSPLPEPPAMPSQTAGASMPAKTPARDPAETLRLAQTIETPIAERAAPALSDPAPVSAPKSEAPAVPAKASPRKPAAKPRAEAPKQRVEKREGSHAANDSAEQQFRRAALYLNQGRVSEAEEQLIGALRADPSHVAARQAYVALLLEQKRTDAAQRLLRDALAKDPTQPVFSLALARILAEQHDYSSSLEVMDRAGGVSKNADFQALRGAVMQRLGRHQEAVDAYLAAIQGGVQPPTTWVGLGISLEALGRKTEAAQAYRRSLGGALSREVREYAESRVRALD